MKYLKVAIAPLITAFALYLPSAYAETIYISVQDSDAQGFLVEVDKSLNVINQFKYPLGYISSLDAASADKRYIYGVATDTVMAFDTYTQKFLNRVSDDGVILFPKQIFLTKPSQETNQEWLYVLNYNISLPTGASSDTLIALERSYFEGDKDAKSFVFDFEQDYNWSHRVVEAMVVDPNDNHHLFIVLSGADLSTGDRQRHILEMRFNESQKIFELVQALPLDFVEPTIYVKKAIIRPQGDWIYLHFEGPNETLMMVNTSNLTQHAQTITNLEDIALTEDGKTLLATYRSHNTSGLQSFSDINNPDKIKMKEDSVTPSYIYQGAEYSYSHERILADRTYHYVPEYFTLTSPKGGGVDYVQEERAKLSTIHLQNKNIERESPVTLVTEDDNPRIAACFTLNTCLVDTIAFGYTNKHELYTAKTLFFPNKETSLLLSKVDLKNPEAPPTFVIVEIEGRFNRNFPSSILIL